MRSLRVTHATGSAVPVPAYRAAMRLMLATVLSTAILVAGCGSNSATPAPVESSSQAGEIAAATCALGPPAQGQFRQTSSGTGGDGVVGAIYNDTLSTIRVGHQYSTEAPCPLKPGERMAFALTGSNTALFAVREGESVGAVVFLVDPFAGYPTAIVSGFSGREGCGSEYSSPGLEEGQEWRSSYWASGSVVVKRLNDDGAIARQWSGWDSWKVDDWARMDVRIERLGEGC